jgi:hypothetical protein
LKGPVPQVQAKEGPMPQVVKKRRSGWAVLAVGALVASLFAVGAVPAAADEIGDEDGMAEVDYEAAATACLGPATVDGMFSDVSEGHAFGDAINCLAHYEVTVGTGDGSTFSPNVDVPRYQMVLFMERAAALVGADSNDVLGDFATRGADDDTVTRAEMAVLIANLLIAAPYNDVERNDDGVIVIDDDDSSTFDYFADVRGVPGKYDGKARHVDEAVSALYELGVVSGTGDGLYSPDGTVNRGAMAAFITRALGHTNARPIGLTAQVSAEGITVSVRDDSRAPVVNQAVDAFYIAVANETKAFKDDDTCSSRVRAVEGGVRCEIDGGDPVTLSDGNVLLATPSNVGEGLTVWVWIGEAGDELDADMDPYEFSIEPGEDTAATATIVTPDNLKVESDLGLKGTAKAEFGDTVTITVQLQVMKDGEDVDAARGDDDLSYNLVEKTYTSDGTVDADGNIDLTDQTVLRLATSTLDIDADGSASFTVTMGDPDPSRGNVNSDPTGSDNYRVIQYTIDDADNDATEPHMGTVTFTDERSVVTAVSVEAGAPRSAPGTTPSGAAATVTLLDQYGDPVSGQLVRLVSDVGSAPTSSRITGRSGQVRIGYTYTGNAAVENLTAWWNSTREFVDAQVENDPGEEVPPCPETGMAVSDPYNHDDDVDTPEITQTSRCGSAKTFWVGSILHANTGPNGAANSGVGGLTSPDDDLPGTVTILSIDTENKQIVVDTDDEADIVSPNSISYDSNDYFSIGRVTTDTKSPSTMEGFEESVTKALDDDDDDVDNDTGAPTLTWADYVFDDPSESAWFQVVTNLPAPTNG